MGRRTLSEIVCMPTIFAHRANYLRGALALGLVLVASGLSACNSTSEQPDGGPVCAQGVPDGGVGGCIGATACTNGVCDPTCDASGAGCAPGFYCEDTSLPVNVCSPVQTVDCQTDLDCPVPQSCGAGGICYTLETRANGSTDGCLISNPVDGCAPDSLCYQIANPNGTGDPLNYCVGLSHCSEDGGCPADPTGSGAVCNQIADGGYIFPGKERLCLSGFCVDHNNCPSGTACFYRTQGGSFGQCQGGFPADPCYTSEDCFNSPTGCNVSLDGGVDGGLDDGGSLGVCY